MLEHSNPPGGVRLMPRPSEQVLATRVQSEAGKWILINLLDSSLLLVHDAARWRPMGRRDTYRLWARLVGYATHQAPAGVPSERRSG